MAWSAALHAAHSHRDDLAAAGLNALLQRGNVGVFAGAGHQPAVETSAADLQRRVLGGGGHDLIVRRGAGFAQASVGSERLTSWRSDCSQMCPISLR